MPVFYPRSRKHSIWKQKFLRTRHDLFIRDEYLRKRYASPYRSLLKVWDQETRRLRRCHILHPYVSNTDRASMAEKKPVTITQPKVWRNQKEKGRNGLGILVFINIYFISSNCLIIINIIIFIFVSSQTNLIDRILCPCYYMIQLALISSHFTHFPLTDCTTQWCSLISICNVISQE